ncbi:MAG: class I SAM-dependent methyltransferase [Myxococcota bacterium]|nr:class I SAM-dependent methyltransferase [Myxococcota bacterium]
MLDERARALLDVARQLSELGYAFTTVTPETHRRVVARRGRAASLRDVFGWSMPFEATLLPVGLLASLRAAEAVSTRDGLLYPTVRFSRLHDKLYAHSAYPTVGEDAVFFGPDTYRFCDLLEGSVQRARCVVDVGCGSGVGGLSLAERCERIVLADINPHALRFARINAHLAGVADRTELVQGDLFAPVAGDVDLVIANPPYLVDGAHRTYRDGGGELGEGLAVRIVREAAAKLTPGGRLVLYTGAAIVDGRDLVRASIAPILDETYASWHYRELDPDVFGEELETPAYAAVERIAAVGIVAVAR